MTFRLSLILILCLLSSANSWAQPENKHIRAGNRQYEEGNYGEAITAYLESLLLNDQSFKARYNMANAYYKQERYADADSLFQLLLRETSDRSRLADVYHNLGNAYLQQAKVGIEKQGQAGLQNPQGQQEAYAMLDSAIQAYKDALRNQPGQADTQYNLTYAYKLRNQQGGGDGSDQQDQQDENENENKDDQEQNQQNQQDQQDKSDEEMERMLRALEEKEKQTQKEVERQRVPVHVEKPW